MIDNEVSARMTNCKECEKLKERITNTDNVTYIKNELRDALKCIDDKNKEILRLKDLLETSPKYTQLVKTDKNLYRENKSKRKICVKSD